MGGAKGLAGLAAWRAGGGSAWRALHEVGMRGLFFSGDPGGPERPSLSSSHRCVLTNPRPSTTRDVGGGSEITPTNGFLLPAWVKGPSASRVKNASGVYSPSGTYIYIVIEVYCSLKLQRHKFNQEIFIEKAQC